VLSLSASLETGSAEVSAATSHFRWESILYNFLLMIVILSGAPRSAGGTLGAGTNACLHNPRRAVEGPERRSVVVRKLVEPLRSSNHRLAQISPFRIQ
jgi:hypothetical protein